ncbi:superoxide dismutase family protein [Psychrobacter sp. FDAARGOS_221]|uniref:superoxide dismutase family protein n=1 Tax=Psychrobacter sp. FDAARGOS_221 TaxID=1975705 RepID=UPI000BB53224|nr:superoxide dismutase family protein [Psychrobacter sp. FDAARGOS_221]PNK61189.1 superoxide dismutase family protein [Psychrobacter sp. FDAARGOS_221]
MKKLLTTSTLLASAIALSACQTTATPDMDVADDRQPTLKSQLYTVDGSAQHVGDMYLRADERGVQVFGELKGFAPGSTVAVHIHEKGSCLDMGKAAGGHFNPYGTNHGDPKSANSHAGDLPNVKINANGVGTMNFLKKGISVDTNAENSVYNRAFVVHAGTDDYISQPAGNAGDRIACGVIKSY